MSTNHETMIKEFIAKLESRREMYGAVLVTSYLLKENSKYINISTKFVPLFNNESANSRGVPEKHDYKDAVLIKTSITIDELIELVKSLPNNGTKVVSIGTNQAEVTGVTFGDYYLYDSGDGPLDIGWSFERYQFTNRSFRVPNTALISIKEPFFPSFREVLRDFVGIDVDHYSEAFGLIICLPDYGARIKQIDFTATKIRIDIEPKMLVGQDIIAKVYCKKGKQVAQEAVSFNDTNSSSIKLNFKPESFNFVLLSTKTGDVLDQRYFYFGWGSLPKGVTVDLPEYELIELIKNGETETIEFKKTIDKPTEFAETIVSFANRNGGIIILGVDDRTNIVGLEINLKDTISNIISSHCEPTINYSVEDRIINEKKLLLVKVEAGKDKPYLVREKGIYVRANATDRIASRFEIDEFYSNRSQGTLSRW